MGTSYFSNAEYLYSYIEANNVQKATNLVKEHPQLLKHQLTKDNKCTALGRAIWRGNYELTKTFLGMGAAPDVESNGHTPLMIASYRNNLQIVKLLIEFRARIKIDDEDGLNCLDYAILYGNYAIAMYFTRQLSMKVQKTAQEYRQVAKSKKIYYVNYEIMLDCLSKNFDAESLPDLFKRPPKPKLKDPVINPNETWRQFFSRVSQFDPPPLVQRDSLPTELQPQNRAMGKLHHYIQRMKGTKNISLYPQRQYHSQLPSNRQALNQKEPEV